MKKLKSFLKNQKGQTLMEYIIVTGLVGLFCMLTMREFGEGLKSKIDSSTRKLNKHLTIRAQ